MGYLLPALTDAKFANQREVVLNERRQNYENRPVRPRRRWRIVAELYPADHPYNWLTIGAADESARAHIDDVREFFQTLLPSRATRRSRSPATSTPTTALRARREILRRHRPGGEARAGSSAGAATLEPARAARPRGPRRVAAAVSRVALAGMFADGRCGAGPGGGRARRRQDVASLSRAGLRAACRDRGGGIAELARNRRLLPGRRDRRARTDAGRVRGRDHRGDGRVAADGPTAAEIERGVAQAEAQFISRLQTVGGFGGKSDQLNAYNVFLGDPGFLRPRLAAYRAATPTACARRETWLTRDTRVMLSVVPAGRAELALAGSVPVSVS